MILPTHLGYDLDKIKRDTEVIDGVAYTTIRATDKLRVRLIKEQWWSKALKEHNASKSS